MTDEKGWRINLYGRKLREELRFLKDVETVSDKEMVRYIRDIRGLNTVNIVTESAGNKWKDETISEISKKNIQIKKLWDAEINTPEGVSVTIFRKMDESKVKVAKEALKQLLRADYVSEVKEYTNWLNPIRLVKKPNGKIRFFLDLRGLNEMVKQDTYPIPTIANITDSIRDERIFSN